MFSLLGFQDAQAAKYKSGYAAEKEPETLESLRKELQAAKLEIHKLKTALGSNHPMGYKSGGLLG